MKVEDLSVCDLGETVRVLRGPNYPPGCPNSALFPTGFAEPIEAQVSDVDAQGHPKQKYAYRNDVNKE